MSKRLRDSNDDINDSRLCNGCDRELTHDFYSFTPKMIVKDHQLTFNIENNNGELNVVSGIDYCKNCFNVDRCKIGKTILGYMSNHRCEFCCTDNQGVMYYNCILDNEEDFYATIGLCIPCIRNNENKPSFDLIC